MAVIDHLVYAVPDLAAGIDWFESQTGVRAAIGGAHPGQGTHNALASFGDSYLELIGPDPDQADHDGPRPFGVTTEMTPRLVTFAARPAAGETIESLVSAARSAGHDLGDIVAMSRTPPSGAPLHWRLTFPSLVDDGLVPFLIDWGDTPHPADSAPGGVTLVDVTGKTPDHEHANNVLDAIGMSPLATEGHGGLHALCRSTTGSAPLVL